MYRTKPGAITHPSPYDLRNHCDSYRYFSIIVEAYSRASCRNLRSVLDSSRSCASSIRRDGQLNATSYP
jgi:hypothetical protein